jgi:alcohol dehydrogenase class IV
VAGEGHGLLASSFRKAVRDGDDHEARADMAIAATFAGMGFGNAGVHIPHANGRDGEHKILLIHETMSFSWKRRKASARSTIP